MNNIILKIDTNYSSNDNIQIDILHEDGSCCHSNTISLKELINQIKLVNKPVETDNEKPKDCYCDKDQGAGYTYSYEHGECDICINRGL